MDNEAEKLLKSATNINDKDSMEFANASSITVG